VAAVLVLVVVAVLVGEAAPLDHPRSPTRGAPR